MIWLWKGLIRRFHPIPCQSFSEENMFKPSNAAKPVCLFFCLRVSSCLFVSVFLSVFLSVSMPTCLLVCLSLSLSLSYNFTNLPISLGILCPCPDGPPLVPTYQKASERRQNYKYITQYNGQSAWWQQMATFTFLQDFRRSSGNWTLDLLIPSPTCDLVQCLIHTVTCS